MFKNSKFFYGYASIFNQLDLNKDVILGGAKWDKACHLPLLLEHNPKKKIGVIERITQNDRGLFVEGKIIPEFAKRKINLSIGFIPSNTFKDRDGVRYIPSLRVFEISVVKKGANKNAFAICI
jgi:HK97 family phage prohead protease